MLEEKLGLRAVGPRTSSGARPEEVATAAEAVRTAEAGREPRYRSRLTRTGLVAPPNADEVTCR